MGKHSAGNKNVEQPQQSQQQYIPPQGQQQYAPQNMPPTKKKKPIFKRVWFWLLIILVILIILIASCTASMANKVVSSTSGSSNSASATQQASKYTISDVTGTDSGYGTYKIDGTLTSNENSTLSYVQVSYTLKDSSGAQVGTAYANTTNLAAKGTWKFEAIGTTSNGVTVASYDIANVTGF